MNKKASKIFKNLSYTVLANGINMLVSIVLVLIVPKILGVMEYSYWQLYVFYTSYVGFFHFGWADGIYLRFGGKKYEELDKSYFATQFWLMAFLEVFIAVLIGLFAVFFIVDSDKQFILTITGVCCIVQIPRTLLQYLLQTTNRISDYAKNYMLEKAIYAVLVLTILFLGVTNYRVLLYADLFARTCTLLLLCYSCRDIVIHSITRVIQGVKEAWLNITIGVKLLFANIASLLITGIVRFAVENQWSVETFGKVSLTMTVSNMLMIFINAVSVVMYPILKNTEEKKLPAIYSTLRTTLMVPVLGMLAVYYPAKVLLSMWLPQYEESLRYMALLFPMCVFESKMSMLVNTYLKALRKEKVIMTANWITVALTVIITGITVYVMKNLTLAIASLALLLGARCMISESVLARSLNIAVYKDMIWEFSLAVLFILSSWFIQSCWCTLIYLCAYSIYLLAHREDVAKLWVRFRETVINRRRVSE